MAYKIKSSKVGTQLPIYKIKGEFYFRDKKLGEYRNTKNPFDVIKEKDISLADFQKPTKKDTKKLYEITKEDLEKAEFKAILGGWVEKETYRRLRASYKTQEGLK